MDAASVVLSGVLALLTAVLVWYTRTLAKEAGKTRRQQIQPLVVATFEPSKYPGFVDLVIENVGKGLAGNLQVQADPDIVVGTGERAQNFNEYSFLRLDVLKPGQELRHFLGDHKEISSKPTTLTTRCEDITGAKHVFASEADISVYYGKRTLGSDPFEKIEEHLGKLTRNFEHIVSGFKRIKVDSYSTEDRDQERKKLEAMFNEQQEKDA